MAEPINTYMEFRTAQEARDYRHEHGTGGWIFEPDDNAGWSVLFPPHMPPIAIFHHPLTKGRHGRLLASR